MTINSDSDIPQRDMHSTNAKHISKAEIALHPYKRSIAIVDVKPADQTKVVLGIYTSDHPPKGFATVVSSNEDKNPINSEVLAIPIGRSTRYEYTLILANYGSKKETVEIFEL
jgi:hypothetical protein